MKYVVIYVNGGIVSDVDFFTDLENAVNALSEDVKSMDIEDDDVFLYGHGGMLANAKLFLDENDGYVDNRHQVMNDGSDDRPVYIIGNPNHCLGFMVASPDDPLGYSDPVGAILDLGQMRQDYGSHLKIYEVVTATDLAINRADIEKKIKDCDVEDFDFTLVEDYLLKDQS